VRLILAPGRYFFVIGAMKAGTSTMHSHLAEHPSIYAPARKEPKFFSNPSPGAAEVAAYTRLFANRDSAAWAFESSTAYTKYPMIAGVPERIHAAVPDARLIYLIRNPVDRICSAYLHNVAEGRERRSFEDAVFEPTQAYLNISRYHLQLSQYLRVFRRDQVLVLLFEDFVADVDRTLTEVAQFLDLDDGFAKVGKAKKYNETAQKRSMSPLIQTLTRLPGYRFLPWTLRRRAAERLTDPLPSKQEIIDGRLRERILRELDADLARLGDVLERDFSCWRPARG